ncbi:hypothetical protein OG404_18365 [Streptomyces griseoaurantiacus]|uniref:DUF7701 domain-containing protein n=1 Tax=Streptomyces griseoaurantiacus TaxID=68213 RepID=UPI00352CDDBC
MTNYLEAEARLIREQVPAGTAIPDDSDLLFLVYAVLKRAKGDAVTNSDVHDAWAAWMTFTRGDHPAIVPYQDLTPSVQLEDAPFTAAIRAAGQK